MGRVVAGEDAAAGVGAEFGGRSEVSAQAEEFGAAVVADLARVGEGRASGGFSLWQRRVGEDFSVSDFGFGCYDMSIYLLFS